MKTTLSKSDEQIIRLSPILKFVGLIIALLGLAGVIVGLRKLYVINSIASRNYDEILTGISFSIICYGYFIYDAYRIIEKLNKIREHNNTDNGKI